MCEFVVQRVEKKRKKKRKTGTAPIFPGIRMRLFLLFILPIVVVKERQNQALAFQGTMKDIPILVRQRQQQRQRQPPLSTTKRESYQRDRWILWTKRHDDIIQPEKNRIGSDDDDNSGCDDVSSTIHCQSLSLSDILRQLEDLDIVFSPTANRKDLELRLLQQRLERDSFLLDSTVDTVSSKPTTGTNTVTPVSEWEKSKPTTNTNTNTYPQQHYSSSKQKTVQTDSSTEMSSKSTTPKEKQRQHQKQETSDNRFNNSPTSTTNRPTTRPSSTVGIGPNKNSADVAHSQTQNERLDEQMLRRQNHRRRRRRQQQQQQQKQPVARSVSWVQDHVASPLQNRIVPDRWITLGQKATKAAKQTTHKLVTNWMDWTYEDEVEAGGYGYAARKSRRRRRRHHHQQQQQQQQNPTPQRQQQEPQGRVVPNRKEDIQATSTSRTNTVRPTSGYSDTKKGPSNTPLYKEDNAKTISTKTNHTQRIHHRTNVLVVDTSEPEKIPKDNVAKRVRPIQEILKELEELNVSFSPTASRQELEGLLSTAHQTSMTPHVKPGHDSVELSKAHTETTFAKETEREVLEVSDTYSYTVDDAKVLAEQEDVTDAIEVELLTPEEWEVRQERMRDRKRKEALQAQIMEKRKREQTVVRFVTPTTTSRSQQDEKQHRRPVSMTYGRTASRMRTIPEDYAPRKRTPRRPMISAPTTTPTTTTGATQHPSSRNDRKSRRRVYSPYGTDRAGFTVDDDGEVKDGLNRLGDFLADSVDSMLWGPGDGEPKIDKHNSRKRTAPDRPKPPKQPSVSPFSPPSSERHWRDKLEEQVDYLLGIHKDGETYQRWMNKERNDAAKETGSDALSYARGRATKSRRSNGRSRAYTRKHADDTPFWQQDGSLISILFGGNGGGRGRYPSQYRRSDNGSFGSDIYQALHSSSLSLLLRTLAIFAARLFGSLCRWGSVNNTIPRPLVAFSLFTAGIIVRGPFRARIMNMTFTLLALRVIGEWLDGYLTIGDDYYDDDSIDEKRRVDGEGADSTAPELR
ncbi:hypothetical protein IV203_017830 [Nitzschia inconspicua]|uniref:Uncharacterized protein n=1 Tax=Nitzschia inconspicua TaxID=303405 RepID=A0A9K3KGC5_9STRA|nr:hypothetical protein IV203_020531 [Nitzschia inconspicua]KAG7371689.1 hypothetical protein IV203_017830 [Nitzschia inconspicua]